MVQVCIIGAGKMSRLLVKHLASKGLSRLTILNRSLPRVEELKEEFPEVQSDVHLMPDLMQCIAECDTIFAASGSEDILVHASDLEGAAACALCLSQAFCFLLPLNGNLDDLVESHLLLPAPPVLCICLHGEWLCLPGAQPEAEGCAWDCAGMPAASEKVGGIRRFFDISVPRNIAPDITEAVNGRVFNVDDLKEVVSKNKEERRKAADEAQVLLDQEQLTFEAWRDSLETVPTIKVLSTDPFFRF